ncbi:polynucleotide adenylyltransferase PcnB [Neochlamydia sp. AcF95]|uniref:polynucleotide adenylyltransferase PcnB n=1 Tax=Neochlamydia sp. AcF95 TaxID=2795734 RepID=UPI001BC99EC5|nr:polynucleotide adenylyltransferase PcnB [Neochlamydia sp. AcF95]MBS4170697.1 Poly(A) polymerase I [Neochlamydia sp. AcF95]
MQAKIFHATDHEIEHHLIDKDALYVINRLKEAGFKAYLVGGGVRDLLIKKTPKDFDISTSAKPEQIKQLFGRSCLLIGRRFRLAHVRFGPKILEVATFRSGENDSDLIIQDNVWGTPEEDVLRRDFTINGLFYDPSNHSVIDYVGGWEDIHKRVLRTIGEPSTRFKQDPVRMIRLLKFQARYNFTVVPEVQTALLACKKELIKSSPARILEEIFRMLESGYSSPFFHLMTQAGLLELIFPCLAHFIQSHQENEIYRYLTTADQINLYSKKTLDRSLLTSNILFPILEQEIKTHYLDKGRHPHMGEIMMLTSSLIKGFVTSSFSHFPRRHSAVMNFILSTQYRLTPFSGKRHLRTKLVHNKEFEASLIFLKIRASIQPHLQEAYIYWRDQYKNASRPPQVNRYSHPPKKRRYERPPRTQKKDIKAWENEE